jgi:hypothetical protein
MLYQIRTHNLSFFFFANTLKTSRACGRTEHQPYNTVKHSKLYDGSISIKQKSRLVDERLQQVEKAIGGKEHEYRT